MYQIDLSNKNAIVFGVANHRSIAWAIAKMLNQAGARLVLTYQSERLRENVASLAQTLDGAQILECDVSSDESIDRVFKELGQLFGTVDIVVHSIGFARREDLAGSFLKTDREGFRTALEISAYSLLPIVQRAVPLMKNGGSVITMTFQASERVFPGYNIMSTAKAALENEVRLLAYELGEKNIRVNAVSPGPLETLAARGIRGFMDMKRIHAERAPLRRSITQEEVAKVALFLCSDMASAITGTVIPVDAGYHIMGV